MAMENQDFNGKFHYFLGFVIETFPQSSVSLNLDEYEKQFLINMKYFNLSVWLINLAEVLREDINGW